MSALSKSIAGKSRELAEVKSGGLPSRTEKDFMSATGFHCG